MPRLSMTVAAFLTIAAPLATATSSFAQKPADKPEQAQSNSDKAGSPPNLNLTRRTLLILMGCSRASEMMEKEIKEEEKPASPPAK